MSLIRDYQVNSIKPEEIDEILNKLLLKYQDCDKIIRTTCPACGNDKYDFAFDKGSFHYLQCTDCMSLYIQNILNNKKTLDYEESLNNELYNTQFYNQYEKKLYEKIMSELELILPRLFKNDQVLNIAYFGNKSNVYEEVFSQYNTKFYDCTKNITFSDQKFDFIIIDHFIEKTIELTKFMHKINLSLNDDGFLYITMRVGSGIDILTLWEDCNIYPLEHNNLLSIDGIKKLLDMNEFCIKELNTPGILDIDNILKTQSKALPRFLNYLNQSNNQKSIEEFQTFIQKSLLSSFATIIAQRG